MAKTRIKNTPTRLQKDALIASASAVAVLTAPAAAATAAATVDAKKRVVRVPTNTITTNNAKEQLQATSTIIIPAPKRTNSISSATSTISQVSDTHSGHSDTDSLLPSALTTTTIATASAASNASKILNNVLCAPQNKTLKNRKVFMITEKCEVPQNGESPSSAPAQKRKMYLIMEENTTAEPQSAGDGIETSHKYVKMENGGAAVAPTKKLTLYADKCDGELTQKFEKILPEILSRIQGVKGVVVARPQNDASDSFESNEPHEVLPKEKALPNEESLESNNSNNYNKLYNKNRRLPITLPPKKNRTKIITTTQSAANVSLNQNNNNNNNINNSSSNVGASHLQQTSAATPVIVSAASLNYHNPPPQPPIKRTNGQNAAMPIVPVAAAITPQKNINLSTDFLFLMKMLPKLESIPEPHKNHVRSCIEKIVTQNAIPFEK